MKIGLQLCFEMNAVDGKLYSYLFNRYVRFRPYAFLKGARTRAWNEKKHLHNLAKATSDGERLIAYDLSSNIFSVSKTGTHVPHLSIYIVQEADYFMPSEAEITEIISYYDGFVAGYLYDEEYHSIQSETSPSNLEHRNIPIEKWDTIKHTPRKQDVFHWRYETRFNAGRKLLIEHTFLLSCWKMWYGGPFFQLVSKEKLLSFGYADEVKELRNGQIYVKLFEDVRQSHMPDAIFRQWKWQEWIDFDKLEQTYG